MIGKVGRDFFETSKAQASAASYVGYNVNHNNNYSVKCGKNQLFKASTKQKNAYF